MRVYRATRTCQAASSKKGPRMGQTWPIPEAHGHGALVTAERCFGIDMRTGRRFFLGLSAPLRVQAFIINTCMKQLRAYQTRLVERKTCSKVSKGGSKQVQHTPAMPQRCAKISMQARRNKSVKYRASDNITRNMGRQLRAVCRPTPKELF